MKDFTLTIYKQLLQSLISKDYKFLTVEEYFTLTPSPSRPLAQSQIRPLAKSQSRPTRPIASSQIRPLVIMRHDVDRIPQNALRMAKLENELEIRSTYYFRIIPQTFKPDIIKKIVELGHEIGYHYENLCDAEVQIKNLKCLSRNSDKMYRGKIKNSDDYKKKLFELAIKDFEFNLNRLREIAPISNIAMHGRPTSKWDSRLLWEKYDYKDYGILSEPYFDIDFNEVLYITDSGRSWNNENINLRDKVESKFNFSFNHTNGIIKAINDNELPEKIMINIHPEHWALTNFEWFKIWIIRKVKNFGKRILIRSRARRGNFIERICGRRY